MIAASQQQWAAQLLAGLGGQPCRDADTGQAGVWLPLRHWENLASIARGSPMAHGYALAGQYGQTPRNESDPTGDIPG